jgi:hypothetical protein
MTDHIKARCHCGVVCITLPATAAGVIACHCGDCQKLHGNFNTFLAAAIAEIKIEGTEALVWYQSSKDSRRAFCGKCGSRVVKEVTPAGRWLISAGLVDGPIGKHIVKNLWEQSKPDWYHLPPATA